MEEEDNRLYIAVAWILLHPAYHQPDNVMFDYHDFHASTD